MLDADRPVDDPLDGEPPTLGRWRFRVSKYLDAGAMNFSRPRHVMVQVCTTP
jgi:hypothetical protein